MNNYLRPIDNRFQLNGVSMPRPHKIKVKRKWLNADSHRDINTGALILNPKIRLFETTWHYNVLRDDQLRMILAQVFQESKSNYEKTFSTYDPVTNSVLTYTTYEQDDFEIPESTTRQPDGHVYYTDIEFLFTNVGGEA